jgi:hypothetical protein
MLALPLQRAHRIDLVPILKAFLNTSFGSGSDERFEADLTGFQVSKDKRFAEIDESLSIECFRKGFILTNKIDIEDKGCCYCCHKCF